MSDASSVKALLSENGVRDVKFLFHQDLASRSPSAVLSQATVLLSTYFKNDEYKQPASPVGELSFIQ